MSVSTKYKGLSASEAKKLSKKYGPNYWSQPTTRSFYHYLAKAVFSTTSVVLVLYIFIFTFINDIVPHILWAVFLVNILIEAILDRRTVNAFSKLGALRAPLEQKYRVLRDDKLTSKECAELTIGDVIKLGTWEFVPADATAIFTQDLVVKRRVVDKIMTLRPEKGAEILAGDLIVQGFVTAKVIAIGFDVIAQSYVPRTQFKYWGWPKNFSAMKSLPYQSSIFGVMVAVLLLGLTIATGKSWSKVSITFLLLPLILHIPVSLNKIMSLFTLNALKKLRKLGLTVTNINALLGVSNSKSYVFTEGFFLDEKENVHIEAELYELFQQLLQQGKTVILLELETERNKFLKAQGKAKFVLVENVELILADEKEITFAAATLYYTDHKSSKLASATSEYELPILISGSPEALSITAEYKHLVYTNDSKLTPDEVLYLDVYAPNFQAVVQELQNAFRYVNFIAWQLKTSLLTGVISSAIIVIISTFAQRDLDLDGVGSSLVFVSIVFLPLASMILIPSYKQSAVNTLLKRRRQLIIRHLVVILAAYLIPTSALLLKPGLIEFKITDQIIMALIVTTSVCGFLVTNSYLYSRSKLFGKIVNIILALIYVAVVVAFIAYVMDFWLPH